MSQASREKASKTLKGSQEKKKRPQRMVRGPEAQFQESLE
ncbi:conserved hypothetical protein [delta proteobacterium NaphS2]|nr:conserved hypothetical protein [delta proteobacterium NaphS2]